VAFCGAYQKFWRRRSNDRIELSIFAQRTNSLVLLFVGVAVLIPDLSDTQVIVYSRWDRSPDIMEDQVTYPITSALLGLPKVKDIRGFSYLGYSYV